MFLIFWWEINRVVGARISLNVGCFFFVLFFSTCKIIVAHLRLAYLCLEKSCWWKKNIHSFTELQKTSNIIACGRKKTNKFSKTHISAMILNSKLKCLIFILQNLPLGINLSICVHIYIRLANKYKIVITLS